VKNGDGGLIGIPASSAEKSINWPARYNHCMEESESDLNRAPGGTSWRGMGEFPDGRRFSTNCRRRKT